MASSNDQHFTDCEKRKLMDSNFAQNEVSLWLRNIVKLPQYISIFMEEGYDELMTSKVYRI